MDTLIDDGKDAGASRSLVDRVLAIIGAFQDGPERQTLSDLSRHTGLPVATVYRILQRLAAWGALERDDNGRYRIGLRLWEVGTRSPRWTGLQRAARPSMHRLAESMKCCVQLAIRDGNHMVSIERFSQHDQTLARTSVGTRYGMHSTAIGLVLLAYAPGQVRQEVLTHPLVSLTQFTVVSPTELVRVLREIRARGYAISDRQATPTHLGIAAPVLAPDGSAIAALSLVCGRARARIPDMATAVRMAAAEVGRTLRRQPAIS